MQHTSPDRGTASFSDSSSTFPYQYFGVPNSLEPKQINRQRQPRYASSGSASPSIPQSLDNPPSTLSSTSGASGRSTASSTVGSPYSLATHSLPGQDTWSESNQGLGIAPDIVRNDGFTHDAFPGSSIESELCYQDAKFSDSFVDPSLIQAFDAPENARATSLGFEEDGKERGRCPNADCGRLFKDLKAHMLTHQSERPEKCPIMTCEYHQKGFARKYDKNRHTLTHYKGTMVCGFCPGSGSAAEKSFNRADVFKRHLTSLHGVEQTPPNSRKKSLTASHTKKASDYSGDAAGKCSTCSAMFNNAQEFYEHLDDCVLRVVQQEEPSEAINEQHLSAVANDQSVLDTLDRNQAHAGAEYNEANACLFDAEEVDGDDDGEKLREETRRNNPRSGKGVHTHVGGGTPIRKPGRGVSGGRKHGMTLSKGGVPLVGKGRKKRKHYPMSWGCSADKMKMKKRVLCVYDGPRRLCKDDMMLDSQFEVRMRFGDSDSYVTDLDVNTLKRANALLNATEEEKGPWVPEDEADIQRLMS
ncbi:MAG: hypothetical protein LQ344_002519 [Seirophora lacunosa]|nr:MAG: hypothetical protein LQ344_002519 [Seirophora lacunosa]